jgi:hypothetical protein
VVVRLPAVSARQEREIRRLPIIAILLLCQENDYAIPVVLLLYFDYYTLLLLENLMIGV